MMIEAVSPQRTSAIENSALSAASTTSQAAMMPVPPPKQPPWTSATVGTGAALSRLHRLGGRAGDAEVLLAARSCAPR